MALKVKTVLYKSMIRAAVSHGFSLWDWNECRTGVNKLLIMERKLLRWFTGVFRDEDGLFYSNKILYEAAELRREFESEGKEQTRKFRAKKLGLCNKEYVDRVKAVEDRVEAVKPSAENLSFRAFLKKQKEVRKGNENMKDYMKWRQNARRVEVTFYHG